jgi:hypothetical protein
LLNLENKLRTAK